MISNMAGDDNKLNQPGNKMAANDIKAFFLHPAPGPIFFSHGH